MTALITISFLPDEPGFQTARQLVLSQTYSNYKEVPDQCSSGGNLQIGNARLKNKQASTLNADMPCMH